MIRDAGPGVRAVRVRWRSAVVLSGYCLVVLVGCFDSKPNSFSPRNVTPAQQLFASETTDPSELSAPTTPVEDSVQRPNTANPPTKKPVPGRNESSFAGTPPTPGGNGAKKQPRSLPPFFGDRGVTGFDGAGFNFGGRPRANSPKKGTIALEGMERLDLSSTPVERSAKTTPLKRKTSRKNASPKESATTLIAVDQAEAMQTKLTLKEPRPGDALVTALPPPAAFRKMILADDADLVAAGTSTSGIYLWRLSTEGIVRRMAAHPRGLIDLDFDGNAKRLATCGAEGTAVVWSVDSGDRLRTFRPEAVALAEVKEPFNRAVLSVALSADGKTLYTGCGPKTHQYAIDQLRLEDEDLRKLYEIQVWDVDSGKHKANLRMQKASVVGLDVSKDGRRLASGSTLDRTFVVWSTATNKPEQAIKFSDPTSESARARRLLRLSPDGQWLAGMTADGNSIVTVWDVDSGGKRTSYSHELVQSLAWSNDGRLGLGFKDGKTAVFDPSSKEAYAASLSENKEHSAPVLAVGFKGDGRFVSVSADQFARVGAAGATKTKEGGVSRASLVGSSGQVSAWSPQFLITGDQQGRVELWDLKEHGRLRREKAHEGQVADLAFLPGGDQYVTCAGDMAKLHTMRTRYWAGQGRPGRFGSAGFMQSRAGDGSKDFRAILWETKTGKKIREFSGHQDGVLALDISADGRRLVTGSFDKTAAVWDLATGKRISELVGHRGAVMSVAISRDGRTVVTGGHDGIVAVWEAETGKLTKQLLRHPEPIHALDLNSSGLRVLIGSLGSNTADTIEGPKVSRFGGQEQGFLVIVDLSNGRETNRLDGHKSLVIDAKFHPDGRHVVSSNEGSETLIHHLVGDAPPEKISAGGKLSIANNGKYIAIQHRIYPFPRSDPPVEEAARWHHLRGARGLGMGLDVTFSRDGRWLVVGSSDKTAVAWDLRAGEIGHRFRGHSGYATSVAVSPDGGTLAVGSLDHRISIWDLATGAHQRLLTGARIKLGTSEREGFGTIEGRGLPLSWDFQQTARGNNRTLDNVLHFRPSGGVTSLMFSRDGKHLYSASSFDQKIISWDVVNGKYLWSYFHREVDGATYDLALHPSKPLITSAHSTFDGDPLLVWPTMPDLRSPDAADAKPIKLPNVNALEEGHTCVSVDYAPDGDYLVSGHRDSTVRLIDLATSEVKSFWDAQAGAVEVIFDPNGDRIVTGGGDGVVAIWSLDGRLRKELRGHSGGVTGLAFAPGGKRLASVSKDGTTRLWDMSSGRLLAILFSFDGGVEWAVVDELGHFDGTPKGLSLASYRVAGTNEVLSLDHFFAERFHPGLLAEIWRDGPVDRKTTPLSPPPQVIIADVERRSSSLVSLTVRLVDRGGGVHRPWLVHNQTRSAAKALDAKKHEQFIQCRFEAELTPGVNSFQVHSSSKDASWGSTSETLEITHEGGPVARRLFALVVGVSEYAELSRQFKPIRFCAADGRAISELLKSDTASLYQQTQVTELYDHNATKERILAALDSISRQAKPWDVFMLFVAGHGYNVGQRYYFLPHEFEIRAEDPEKDIRRQALAVDELAEVVARIPALQRAMVFDTCHSGAVQPLADGARNLFAARGASTRAAWSGGVFTLVAAAADQRSFESGELGHSVLTYTLLAGAGKVDGSLYMPRAKRPKTPSIDVADWFRFAETNASDVTAAFEGRLGDAVVSFSGPSFSFPLLEN